MYHSLFISLQPVVVGRNYKVLFIPLTLYKVIPHFIRLNVDSHLVCDDGDLTVLKYRHVAWEAIPEECDLVGVLGQTP